MPESASRLRLTKLSLSRNRLRTFPTAVLAMKSLVELDISAQGDERFAGMPDDIGALVNLESLGYAQYKVPRLPESLFTLKRLTTLDLMFCTLQIPPQLASLASLRTLQLSYSSWRDRAPELREMLPNCKVIAPS